MNLFLIKFEEKLAYLDQDEMRHCLKVLRHRPGDYILGIDGMGNQYSATITEVEKKRVLLTINETQSDWGEKTTYVRLALSPLRAKDRFEWAVEKAVELGVNEICPVICHRTVKSRIKPERISSIMLSALKQCKRSRLPVLKEAQPLQQWLSSPAEGLKYIPWCETQDTFQTYRAEIGAAKEITLLIGPEGDFTEEEVSFAKDNGFIPVSLGENRLRTETAAIFSMGILKWENAW